MASAVEMYGIIDWYTMLQHEDPSLQEYEKSLLGDPVKNKAVYEATSPIKYIRNEKAPLLILTRRQRHPCTEGRGGAGVRHPQEGRPHGRRAFLPGRGTRIRKARESDRFHPENGGLVRQVPEGRREFGSRIEVIA